MLAGVKSIFIMNFRSIVNPLEIPVSTGFTFLLGQNNSGKSSILRFIALLLNASSRHQPDDAPLFGNGPTRASIEITGRALAEFAKDYKILQRSLQGELDRSFTATCTLSGDKRIWRVEEDIFNIVPHAYFHGTSNFLHDFGSAHTTASNNLVTFGDRFIQFLKLPNTVFVPGQRLIVTQGHSMPHYGQVPMPGETSVLNTIVGDLASLDRPHGTAAQRADAQQKMQTICEFLRFCLEVRSVDIKVASEKETIYVSIDDSEQPISHLGSGVEQLLVIGLSSFKFSDRLVLIDEPELHFHPRTQKRMMKFLRENSKAKFVIATHSAAILDSVPADIVQVSQSSNATEGRTIRNQVDRYNAVRNLGYAPSDLVLTNFVIWVEGPSDRIYIKYWIEQRAPELSEGTEYTVLFYGGSLLARHSFNGSEVDLVNALSIAKDFAVYMDSDKIEEDSELKSRVQRVLSETVENGGYAWVSIGREIENYVPQETLDAVGAPDLNGHTQYGRIWNGDNFDKVRFAEKAIGSWQGNWPYDLEAKVGDLIERIRRANRSIG